MILTTNLHFEQWTEVLGSERLTGAALDRLTHRCHIIEANGESFRLQDARKRAPARQGQTRTANQPVKPFDGTQGRQATQTVEIKES